MACLQRRVVVPHGVYDEIIADIIRRCRSHSHALIQAGKFVVKTGVFPIPLLCDPVEVTAAHHAARELAATGFGTRVVVFLYAVLLPSQHDGPGQQIGPRYVIGSRQAFGPSKGE